jgi:hypothetical protein
MRVLFKGPYFLTQALLPVLADGGAIINVTSNSIFQSGMGAGASAYASMKGGRSQSRRIAMNRPPLPPFNDETATQKARLAEDAWNTRDPARVALGYTTDSRWRNRSEFLRGREAIEALSDKKVEPRARLPADQGTLGLQVGSQLVR